MTVAGGVAPSPSVGSPVDVKKPRPTVAGIAVKGSPANLNGSTHATTVGMLIFVRLYCLISCVRVDVLPPFSAVEVSTLISFKRLSMRELLMNWETLISLGDKLQF